MEFLTLLLSAVGGAVAYRMRGNGARPLVRQGWPSTFAGRVLWAVWMGLTCWWLFGLQHALLGMGGAFAGMWIPHGRFYRIETMRQFGVMVAIYVVRFLLVGIWAGPQAIPAAVLAGWLCALANYGACQLQRRGVIVDQLRVAEPVIGAVFGGLLWLLSV